MGTYAADLREAARLYHLTWCDHPHCVHTPFDTDLEHVGPIFGVAEAAYAQRDVLEAACHHLLSVVGALAGDLAHLDELRPHLERARAVIAEALP